MARTCRFDRGRPGLCRTGYIGYARSSRNRRADDCALWTNRPAPLGSLALKRPQSSLGGDKNHPESRQCVAGTERAVLPVLDPALPAGGLPAPARQLQPVPGRTHCFPSAFRGRCRAGLARSGETGRQWRVAPNAAIERHDPSFDRRLMKMLSLTPRQYLIVAHDLLATALAIVASFFIRFEETGLAERFDGLVWFLPGFVVYAGFIYFLFGLHASKWRFTSLPDLYNIMRAATVLAVSLLVLDYILVSPQVYGAYFFGKITIVLYWFLQMAFLAGSRVAYRQFRYVRTQQHVRGEHSVPTLVLGRAADAEVLLRAIESGAVSRVRPVGILSPSLADRGQSIRGIPVAGSLDDLEQIVRDSEARGTHILRLIFTPSALVPEAAPESTLMRARRLGMHTSRLPVLSEGGEAVQLAPIAVEDLLLRPSVTIDYHRLENVVRGKSIIVTGGGGSIGAEICDRVVTFGAARLLVVEHSEVALHSVVEALRAKVADAEIDGRIADVRDRERMMRVFADFKPDVVFHAAALKHVPLLERDWGEGVKTNVFGSVNVIDAAVAAAEIGRAH